MNKQQILQGGIGKSGKFKPLKPATIKRKGHNRPLIHTGSLLRKATRGGRVQAGFVAAFRMYTFKFTILHKAIIFLQKGTKRMPARRVIDPNERQQEMLSDQIWKAIRTAYKKIGWFDRLGTARLTGFDRVDVG
jgi:hypothetical protein